jgi:hypothetical protein
MEFEQATFELLIGEAERRGFEKAIEALKHVDQYRQNGGVTCCMHSAEWAQFLSENKTKILASAE